MTNAGGFTQLVAGVACLAVAYAPLAPVVWGGSSDADQLPPTLRSAGVGSGQSSGGTGGASGTLPGLGPCAPNCGPSGTTTRVGLGGAMNALGGS